MRIAVTGAGGGLGRAFLASVAAEHDVRGFTRRELDVRSGDAVMGTLGTGFDLVLHLAALTGVDACEEDPHRAAETNVLGTFNVAEAARRSGATLVALSTDYVFDGEKGTPYVESDVPNPLSVYARTKLAGERAAAAVVPDALIVRTAWVFGSGEDFVSVAVRQLRLGEEVGAIVDQVGSPTHFDHLAQRLVPLVASGVRGVVHLAGPEATTWHSVLARARSLGTLPGEVLEQKADELGRLAPRPAYSALSSEVLPRTEVPSMPPLDEAIRRVVADVG